MSSIVDFAAPYSFSTNILNGFDIVGLDKSENIVRESANNDTIASGTIQDLVENIPTFDFVEGEVAPEKSDIALEGEAILDELGEEETAETDENGLFSEVTGKDVFSLEFFNNDLDIDGEFTIGDDGIVVRGASENTDLEYDEISGSVSVNGQEIAQFDVSLDFDDDRYDIF